MTTGPAGVSCGVPVRRSKWASFLIGLFFFSLPLQRRYARGLDLRRPGIILDGDLLAVPVPGGLTLNFKLDEPHELTFGWFRVVVKSTGGPTSTPPRQSRSHLRQE